MKSIVQYINEALDFSEKQFFALAKTQPFFVDKLEMLESLTKAQYVKRIQEMYEDTSGDSYVKSFLEAAKKANFTHVKKNQQGIVFSYPDGKSDDKYSK